MQYLRNLLNYLGRAVYNIATVIVQESQILFNINTSYGTFKSAFTSCCRWLAPVPIGFLISQVYESFDIIELGIVVGLQIAT